MEGIAWESNDVWKQATEAYIFMHYLDTISYAEKSLKWDVLLHLTYILFLRNVT